MRTVLAKAWPFIKANGPAIGLTVLVNIILPVLIFDLTRRQLGDVRALIASSAPPIGWSVIEFARHRRIDALSALTLTGIALSLLAFFGGGGPRFLQLREQLVNVLIGAIFLGSAAIRKPLIYELARATMARQASSELADFVALRDNIYFRRVMSRMTLVWGFGLVASAGAHILLVFTLTIRDYLIAGPILGYTTLGSLGLWTFWYSRRQRRIGEARRAAAAKAATEVDLASPV